MLRLSLTGRVWDTFEGTSTTSLVSSTGSLPITSKLTGAFGEFLGSAKVFGTDNGLSGFLNAGLQFKHDYNSATLMGGLRYHW